MSITELIGKNIRRHRRAKEITIQELSEKSGLTVNYISLIEKGDANASLNKIHAIIQGLQVHWEDVIPTPEEEKMIKAASELRK
ncbi:helix-turn-helix transcriptional regulator [Rossellomorea oryzaecorticis]|uniref:Helix-turn-helix transcriptional regulator n=1 Tax=Rossellomorea oryzaecorticis TaxID=1396505 RepID=A0ABU9KDU3_9BACI